MFQSILTDVFVLTLNALTGESQTAVPYGR